MVALAAFLRLTTQAGAAAEPQDVGAGIQNIHAFLEQCPTADPAYAQIRSDFILRRNGVMVPMDVSCAAPMSVMQVSTELEVLQALRVMYYSDPDRTVSLPWAPGQNLYEWMKSQVAGINLVNAANWSCCDIIDGKRYIAIKDTYAPGTAPYPGETYDWEYIAARIGLLAHETRHVAGPGHVACSFGSSACDQTYSDSNPGSYGVVYWLHRGWMNGAPNVGFACADPWYVGVYGEWHRYAANSNRLRILTDPPPELTLPANPGGSCPEAPSLHAIGGANPASVLAGGSTQLTVAAVRAFSPDSSGITVAADLRAIGGPAHQNLTDIGWYNDRLFYNRVLRLETTIAPGTPPGTVNLPIIAADTQGRQATSTIALVVRPATSSVRGDFTGDLKSDILWRHATRGDVWLWPMDGAARTVGDVRAHGRRTRTGRSAAWATRRATGRPTSCGATR